MEIGFQNHEIMDNLLFYYRYDSPFVNDGIVTAVKDVTNNKLNSVMSGGVSKVTTNGGGMSYNGTNGLVGTPDLTTNIQSFTYECWFKPAVLGTRKNLISTNQTSSSSYLHSIWVELHNTNKFLVFFGSPSGGGKVNLYFSPQTVANTNIIHVAYTRWNDTKKQEFIINGVSGGIADWTDLTLPNNTWSTNGLKLRFGLSSIAGFEVPMNGIKYSEKLYTVPLSAAQVKQNYNATQNRFGI